MPGFNCFNPIICCIVQLHIVQSVVLFKYITLNDQKRQNVMRKSSTCYILYILLRGWHLGVSRLLPLQKLGGICMMLFNGILYKYHMFSCQWSHRSEYVMFFLLSTRRKHTCTPEICLCVHTGNGHVTTLLRTICIDKNVCSFIILMWTRCVWFMYVIYDWLEYGSALTYIP